MADAQRPLGGLNRPAHANISSGPARPRHAVVSDRPQPTPAPPDAPPPAQSAAQAAPDAPAAPAAQPAAPAAAAQPTAAEPAARRIRRSDGETRITRSFPAQKGPASKPEPPGPAPGTPEPALARDPAPAPPPVPGANAPGCRAAAARPPQAAAAAPAARKRRGRGQAAGTPQPATPLEVIRARRRHCADVADIQAFVVKLAALVVLLAVLFGAAFGITPMHNDDMAPRISAGDLLLYYRLAGDWANNDVMVFTKDGTQYVGRIVARGGDTVEVTDEATLVINGSTVLESSIYYTTPKYDDGPAYPVTLAADEFFVLCDYREGARDSRWFGPVRQSEVKGKVITVVRRSGL